MYLLILSIFIFIFLFILEYSKSKSILSINLWLLFSFTFLLLTNIFSGITYNVGNIFRILPYFILCLLLLLVGERLGRYLKMPSYRSLTINLKVLSYISIIGSLLLFFDIIRLNVVRFGFRIEDLNISIFGVIGSVVSSLGLISWLFGLYNYRINRIKPRLYIYLSLLSYISSSILMAGRQIILLTLLSSIILIIWSRLKLKERGLNKFRLFIIKKKQPWLMYIFIILAVNYFLLISNQRSGITEIDNKIIAFEKNFNATTSTSTIKQVKSFGSLSHIYFEFLYYYSHELIRLDLFYYNYDFPPLFGLGQMHYIERRLHFLFGNLNEQSWNEQVIALEKKSRFNSHTWGTFITNFIVDFGRVGTLFACLIFGFVLGLIYRKFIEIENSQTVIRQVIICAGMVFSIQFSPLTELNWTFPLIVSFFIKVRI